MKACPVLVVFSLVLPCGLVNRVSAQMPDHPIITEIFNNPRGLNDGPTGHDPTNAHQEFIEIYIPTLANLRLSLNPDSLRLTFYEIEGDSGSGGRGFVNQRYDLPTIDLDPSNAPTPGALPRPSSGIIVLGWVDYNLLNPPTALAGTPGTRIGLIDGGITVSPSGVMFVAINGAQFSGTTNFPVPVLESRIDIPNENASGVMKNGSNAYLLVNRDDPGFASLNDRSTLVNAFADLPGGTILGLSSLLDGFAGNDDSGFSESLQPFPPGGGIDLDDVLPLGGAFSVWVAQVAEASGGGYARRFVDVPRTTEDTIVGNEDPVFDAVNLYRNVFRSGPFFATPGQVVFTTSPPELSLPLTSRLSFDILANTTARPALLSANTGGNFPIDVAVSVGTSSDPTIVTFTSGTPDLAVPGQTDALPQIVATASANAPHGSIVSAPITVTATNTQAGDPPVVHAIQTSSTIATVLNPTTAINHLGTPIETTVFAAVQGFGADPLVANEFLLSDLAAFISANLGTHAQGTLGHLSTLLNPATNLENIAVVDPLRSSFPSTDLTFINAAGAVGTDDLVTTLLTSAKVLSGSTAYAASLNLGLTGLKAIELAIPETLTKNGAFSPGELLFFADATGLVNNSVRSGLNSVTTNRTFELALIDTNQTTTGIESGGSDDFGIIVETGQVLTGATVVPGEFIFLSYTGGLEGEDIDSVDVPGVQATDAILLDLDNLQDVLGVKSITRLFLIDSGAGGTINIMEAVSLNLASGGPVGCTTNTECSDGNPCTDDVCDTGTGICTNPNNSAICDDGSLCTTGDVCGGGVCAGTPSVSCPTGQTCDPLDGVCKACTPSVAPTPDPSGVERSRYISLVPGNAGELTALQVTLVSSSVFPAWNGTVRWVGLPASFPEEDTSLPGQTFVGAALRCDPVYHDWGTVNLLHVFGAEIMPDTTYEVRVINQNCAAAGNPASFSSPLVINTGKWGDIVDPFFVPGSLQPDFKDISGLIAKFLAASGAPIKAGAQLRPNVVFPSRPIDFNDVSAAVGAFLSTAYADDVAISGPCTCPSAVTCGVAACTSDTACGSGFCVNGFCADACGRCAP